MESKPQSTAYLSSENEYTSFTYKDRTIRFYTGKTLDKYVQVKEWDHGYIVVTCQNKGDSGKLTEDYIDLQPILENLYIDAERFLTPIREVRIRYA